MALGDRVASALLGVDALYLQSLSTVPNPNTSEGGLLASEGLVAVNLSEASPTVYEDWEAAARDWKTLRQVAGELANRSRRAYYEDLASSILAIVSWRQQGTAHPAGVAFEMLGCQMLGVERLAFTEKEWEAAATSLLRRLRDAGHGAKNLAESLRAWEKSTQVPEDDVISATNELLNESRNWVERKMFPLSPKRQMCAIGVRDVAYSAYCDFVGGEVHINLDQPYTLGELRHLVAHEAYPGHATHLAVREMAAASGQSPADVLLVVTDTPTSTIFEGIGDNGMSFCWTAQPDDLLVMDAFRMRILSVCRAAIRLAAGEDPDIVSRVLAEESHGDPAWVEQRMRFLSLPLRRPFIFAYAWGERIVADVYRNVDPQERPRFFDALYKHHHSPRSLRELL
jgi:hypothetical protein